MKIKKKTKADGTVIINESFMPYGTKSLDTKNRITLSKKLVETFKKKMAIDSYEILVSANGDILLRPTASVPSREAWLYKNPEVSKRIGKGLAEAKEGKIERVNNLDSFLNAL